ncbi:helix-turn-helix domain-containing protein [Cryptosporangium arvum]|uniref:helix-turn-helix domain-containing protein n=1 Tax=Cryptosporangium arvum TaxID=80871 RepID=UPI0012EDC0E2|nr:helix-turn-helix transcriptional regulator [Cryptosporangium arvum]
MPRPENPIPSENGALAGFAGALRRLRAGAGAPTYRTIAARAHYAPSRLSEAAAGHHLPTWEVTAAFVRACGAPPKDLPLWRSRWERARAGLRPAPVDAEARRLQTKVRQLLRTLPAADARRATYAQHLRALVELEGVTLRGRAARLGYPVSTLSQALTGRRPFRRDMLVDLLSDTFLDDVDRAAWLALWDLIPGDEPRIPGRTAPVAVSKPFVFWWAPPMREALVSHDLGAVSRLYRAGTEISTQRALAQLVGVSQGTISRLENGRLAPTPALLAQFVGGLRIPSGLVLRHGEVAGPPAVPPGRPVEPPDSQLLATLPPDELADGVRRSIARLYRLDYDVGGDVAHREAEVLLAVLERRLAEESLPRPVETALRLAAGDLSMCAGWTAFDARRLETARHWFTEALTTARTLGSAPLEAHALTDLSYLETTQHSPQLGLGTAAAARRADPGAFADRTALIALREARAHAMLGEERRSRLALDRARTAVGRRHTDHAPTPEWLAHLDENELDGMEGTCLLDLGRARDARPLLRRASGGVRASDRNRALYAVRVGAAHLACGDLADAEEAGADAATLMCEASVLSARVVEELADLRADLSGRLRRAVSDRFESQFRCIMSQAMSAQQAS